LKDLLQLWIGEIRKLRNPVSRHAYAYNGIVVSSGSIRSGSIHTIHTELGTTLDLEKEKETKYTIYY